MYKWGVLACLFVVALVGACGCSLAAPGAGFVPGTTPTLPATYIAGERTPAPVSFAVTPTPTPPTAPVNIAGSQTNATPTPTLINCVGQSCSGFVNVTPVNPDAPFSSFSASPMMAYVSPNTLNPNVTVQFTDTSNNSPTSWDWSFGDINHSTSSAENPIFTYYGYNYYHVNLGVSNILGQSQSTATIGLCPLVASFTTNQTAGLVPLTVQFTDTSTNQPTSWLWNFGDGSTSTLQNPVHTYTTSGVYTVRLDATNTFGSCWDTTEITVSSLTSSFTANQTTGPLPLTVQFSDTSTDNPISWQWNFGDGSTSVQQNPVHTYVHNGTYLVNMASSNDYDTPVSAPTIQIFAYTPYVVSFSFTKSPVPNTNFTTVYFNDKSTGFYGPTSWSWTFGDGSASTQQNPTHQYTSYNQYNITLSATNSQGITGSYNATVKLP